MGRPSVAAERTDQILDAVGRSVARFGFEGLTLEKVAAESGLSRSHVRHYVGNKADLVERFRARLRERLAAPPLDRAAELGLTPTELVVRALFDPGSDVETAATVDAVVAAARFDDALRAEIHDLYAGLEATVVAALAADQPGWSPERRAVAAQQVVALEYGFWTMVEIGVSSPGSDAVRSLVRTLLGLPQAAPTRTTAPTPAKEEK